MAILDFPSNPTGGQVYTSPVGVKYRFNGYAWDLDTEPVIGLEGPVGPDGPTGPQGPAGEVTQAAFDELVARVAALEARLATDLNITGNIYATGDVVAFNGS